MGVDGSRLLRTNHGLQYSDALVLQHEAMVLRGCDQRVELVRPRPLLHGFDSRGRPADLARRMTGR